jgi:hypothetical protein
MGPLNVLPTLDSLKENWKKTQNAKDACVKEN